MADLVYELFEPQKRAFHAQNKFIACISGIQSGKTMTGACWVMKQLKERPKDNGLIIASDYKMLDQATLPKLFEINPILRKYYKQQRSLIELPDGRCIYIRSAVAPESIEGFTAGWCWGDEPGKWRVNAWINLQARVAIKEGQVFLTGTPDRMNWFYHDFYDRFVKGDDDYMVVQWKSKDNPYFSDKEYDRAQRTLSPPIFRKRYEGTFERIEGLVYNVTAEHLVEPFEFDAKDCIAGVDFGYTNPCGVSVIKYSNDGVFYIVDELYEEKLITDELVERCKSFRDKYRVTKFYPDPAEPDRIEEMRRGELNVRKVEKDILAGIADVQNLLQQHKLKVFKTCKYHIDEFSTYHFDEAVEDKNQKEKPVPFNDHLMDSLRYALTTYNYAPPRPKINYYNPINKRTGY